jgi:hypothetical protein
MHSMSDTGEGMTRRAFIEMCNNIPISLLGSRLRQQRWEDSLPSMVDHECQLTLYSDGQGCVKVYGGAHHMYPNMEGPRHERRLYNIAYTQSSYTFLLY